MYCFFNFAKVSEVRKQNLSDRFMFCHGTSLYMTITSALLNVIQITSLDDYYVALDGEDFKVDAAKYIEWMMTCPLMVMQLLIFAGPRVQTIGSYTASLCTFFTLLSGSIASFV